jgi:DNA gyrase subunit B
VPEYKSGSDADHESRLKNQFSIRVSTFNTAANWMLSPELLQAHLRALEKPGHENNRLLDLCCGTGIVGSACKKEGWDPSGIDITPEMAKATSQAFPAIAGKVEAMPYEDHSFDAAVLRQSYMLLDGPRALREIHRVLKKNGWYVLSQSVAFSESDEPQYRKIQAARHINWVRYYSVQDLVGELESNGFRVVSKEFLRIRESSTKWMERAPELSASLRKEILDLIRFAPDSYKRERNVTVENGEVFEDWNWVVLKAKAI